MSTVDSDILLAAMARVEANATLPVAFPDVVFIPPNAVDATWLELTFHPNPTRDYGLAADGPVIHEGFIQINAITRPGAGALGLVGVAGTVIAMFPKGLAVGPAEIYRKPWMSPRVPDGARIYIPVTIPYRACINSQ